MMRLFFVLLLIIPVSVTAEKWETLKSCKLILNSYNDGDSFHLNNKGKEYIFRLYFVDAPETDNQYPKRLKTQAQYWKITKKKAIKLGEKAKKITAEALHKEFTVYTKWEDAKGSSRKSRCFAFVTTESGCDMGELLISNGVARIYGMPADHPKGNKSGNILKKLHSLENKAKKAKLGGWGMKRK